MRQIFQSIGIFFVVVSILGSSFLPFPGLLAKIIDDTGWLAVILGLTLGSLGIILAHRRVFVADPRELTVNYKKDHFVLQLLLAITLSSWLITTVFTLGEAINRYFMINWPAMIPAGIVISVIIATFLQGTDCLKQLLAVFAPYFIFFLWIVFLFSMVGDKGNGGQLMLASFNDIARDSLQIALLFGQMILVRITLPLWKQKRKLLPMSLGGVTVVGCLLAVLLLGRMTLDDAFQVFSYFGKLNYTSCIGFSRYLWDSGALTFILWILCLLVKISLLFYCLINISAKLLKTTQDEKRITLTMGTAFLIVIALVGLQPDLLGYINKLSQNGNYFGWLLLLVGYL